MLKAGVAGAGVFGGFHAAKYAALDGVTLAAIYDRDRGHAETLAARFGAKPFDDYAAFLAAVDAATLATPANTHADFGRRTLNAGRHLYVEKPLATSNADAQALVAMARAAGLVLASGHQERVVFEAMRLTAVAESPIRIEAVRRGVYAERCRDVSCVTDVMIHDLDLALALTGRAGVVVSVEGAYDEVVAEVDFGDGTSGRFEASRIADRRERTMRVVYPSGVVEIDFLAPSFADTTDHGLDPDFAGTPDGRDPLGASVGRFVAAIGGRGRVAVTGEEGAAALALSLAIEASL